MDDIIYQDNKSALLLEWNGKSLSMKQTKHSNIHYFFVTENILKGELLTEWCPTCSMIADFITKPLKGKLFHKFHDIIMGVKSGPSESDEGTKFNCRHCLVQGQCTTGVCWEMYVVDT